MKSECVAVVRSHRRETPISIECGALRSAAATLERVLGIDRREIAIVTDENVERHHAADFTNAARGAGWRVAASCVIAAGERSKSFQTFERIHSDLARGGMSRRGVVVAIGGGVVSDLAGFVAATWLRGVDWFALPTSLLAQVDASIGGKTGIDLNVGKNLVGAFWPPLAVVIDPLALSTLPRDEIQSGRGELLKYALIEGEEEFTRFAATTDDDFARGNPSAIVAIENAVKRKAKLCEIDEFDRGDRRLLNAGHTLGHALEAAAGYHGLPHGEAVAIGLIAEARLAVECASAARELPDRIAAACRGIGLRDRIRQDRAYRERALSALALDKKRANSEFTFALPIAVGEVRIVALDKEQHAAAIARALDSVIELAP